MEASWEKDTVFAEEMDILGKVGLKYYSVTELVFLKQR